MIANGTDPRLRLAQALAARNGAGGPGPARTPPARVDSALDMAQGSTRQPMTPNEAARGVPGDANQVVVEVHPTPHAAAGRLLQLRGQGRDGTIKSTQMGHEVHHWPTQMNDQRPYG